MKLALAETHVIQETKTYLESHGVVLSAFSSRARSDTTILVKNIPYGTTAEQIREMFEAHGKLRHVLVPPAGTMAVVDFEHADEARKAFRAVAYRRLGNSVVYLEMGPLEMFRPTTAIGNGDGDENPSAWAVSATVRRAETIPKQDVLGAGNEGGEDEERPSLSAGTTLFVKNLAFGTTSERLTQVFRALPDFAFARVQTKARPGAEKSKGHGQHPGESRLSMGYGFVGFKTRQGANGALKGMQGFVLDGHALHVSFAGRGRDEDEEGVDDKTKASAKTAKMIVKNVPFEATKKDIRELFR